MDKLAIYLHWPYCARICPYCDFNVYRARGDDAALAEAIIAEIQSAPDFTGPRQISSVHFGGGTPSLLLPKAVAQILEAISAAFDMPGGIEIGLEANPADLRQDHYADLAKAGINRLSFGVQSFDDKALSFLGRDHSGEQARAAIELAALYIDNLSADLIFGYHEHEEKSWAKDLDIALSLPLSHISTYQLTIEPGTAFDRAEARGEARAVNADKSAKLYRQAIKTLTGAGFDHYEVSNFARAGKASQHNLSYWRGGDYLGLGPGAHGRITIGETRYATETYLRPGDYRTAVARQSHGRKICSPLTAQERAEEYVIMGLRISEGISLPHYDALMGSPLAIAPELLDQGYLLQNGDRLFATAQGRMVLNSVTDKLLIS